LTKNGKLEALRKALGIGTQDEAARSVGVSLRTWSAWERGERPAPQAVIDLLEMRARETAHRGNA
jgi:DNA-binding XRE family transcriptional regulator